MKVLLLYLCGSRVFLYSWLSKRILLVFASAFKIVGFFMASWTKQFQIIFCKVFLVAVHMMKFKHYWVSFIATSFANVSARFHDVMFPSTERTAIMRLFPKAAIVRVIGGIAKTSPVWVSHHLSNCLGTKFFSPHRVALSASANSSTFYGAVAYTLALVFGICNSAFRYIKLFMANLARVIKTTSFPLRLSEFGLQIRFSCHGSTPLSRLM